MIFFLFPLVLSIVYAKQLTPEETLDFLKLSAIWKNGRDFPIQDCIFYNFGYDKEFSYPKISLDLHQTIPIAINSHGIQAPSGCSIVLIAGKYTQHVDEIMLIMDNIAEQVNFVPLAVFLFSPDRNMEIKIDSNLRNDYSPAMIFVPNDSSSIGYIFKVMCAGGIVKRWGNEQIGFNKVTDNILIKRNGFATFSYKDVCQKTHVFITHEQEPGNIWVENNTLTQYRILHGLQPGYSSMITIPPEKIQTFIDYHDIVPDYVDASNVYGVYDAVHGNWTGMIGKIEKDEADYAIGVFSMTAGRCSVVQCMEFDFQPRNFYSKYPEKVAPIWNLIGLFPPNVWMYTFISLVLVVTFFKLTSKFYKMIGFKTKLKTDEIVLVPTRVTVIKASSSKSIDYGISSSLAFLVWSVWGGFILHMLLSNYLAVLMKPAYEEPIRNIDDVLASNKKVFYVPGGEFIQQIFATSADPRYVEIGMNRFLVPQTWEEFDDLVNRVFEQNDVISLVRDYRAPGHWYKSNERVEVEYPYGAMMANKKWPLSEAYYYFSLKFCDAGLMRLVTKDMSPPPLKKDVEKLGMDHIYFALGLFGIGISLGILVFCYEFIVMMFERIA